MIWKRTSSSPPSMRHDYVSDLRFTLSFHLHPPHIHLNCTKIDYNCCCYNLRPVQPLYFITSIYSLSLSLSCSLSPSLFSISSRVADPSQRENLGIIVQYKVKVKLCIGGPILGGWVYFYYCHSWHLIPYISIISIADGRACAPIFIHFVHLSFDFDD